MKKFLVIWATLATMSFAPMVAQITQGDPEPPAYPEGMYCTPEGDNYKGLQTSDHPCHCKRMWIPEAGDNDGPGGAPDCCNATATREDPQCKQYCRKEHCKCPVECPLTNPNSADDGGDNPHGH